MSKPTTAPALPSDIDDALEQLRRISMYELAEMVHNERSASPAQAGKNPLVALYERCIHAVASIAAVENRRRAH